MIYLFCLQQQIMMIWHNPRRLFITLSNTGLFAWSASPFGLRCATKVIRPASTHTCWFPKEKAERLNNNVEWVPLAAPSIMQCQSPRKASDNPRSQGCAWQSLSSTHSSTIIKVQTKCCSICCAQLEESNSKLDSKSPLSNKSMFLFYFLTNCLSACQQLELPAIFQRTRFEMCTWFFFFFNAEQFMCRDVKCMWQGWSVLVESLGICNRQILHFILHLKYFSWVNIMVI